MTGVRRAPHFFLGALILVAIVGAAVIPARAAENGMSITHVDVSGAPDVTLTVALEGAGAGDPLPDDAFTLLVSGKETPAALTGLPSDPMQVQLVIDTSGSMQGAPMEAAKAAARSLSDQLPASTQIGVVGFGSVPYEASAPTNDRGATAAAIGALQASGETALYDSVSFGVSKLLLERRAVVLLTDGRDTASAATLEHAVAALAGARTSFYAVVLDTPEVDVAATEALAGAAGGTVVRAADPGALAGVYDSIAAQLASTYQLTFRAVATGSTGMLVRARVGGETLEAEARASIPLAAAVTQDVPTRPAPEPPSVGPQPSFLERDGAKWAGLAAMFLAIALLVGVALSRAPRPNQLAERFARRASRPSAIQNLSEQASALAERSLDRSGRRSGVEKRLEQAGINMRAGEFIVLVATVAFATFALALIITNGLIGIVMAAAVVLGTRTALTYFAERRRRKFGDQLEQTLPLMAGSLRAGFGLMQSLDAVARESEAPTSDEFRRLVVETRLGRDLDDGLEAMADRVGSEDFRWVVQAIEIHRQVGGDLAEVLDNVHATLRERNQLRRRISALSGEGKLSAIILFILPVAMLAFIALVNPDYLGELTSRGLGVALLFGAAGLMVAGGFWMRRICRLVF
jgi:tight adherence protein B